MKALTDEQLRTISQRIDARWLYRRRVSTREVLVWRRVAAELELRRRGGQ